MDTSERYDALQYPSKFFVQTNPNRLGAYARLLGLKPADPANCRMLEFGCGNGSNLISQAFLFPDSTFVGVDISAEHIRFAREIAEGIGLLNIEFLELDVMDIDPSDFGKFDYLVAHGLISWIPEEVTDRVFELSDFILSDTGIGYISYNCFPGGHLRTMVRELMMYHTRDTLEPLKKVEKASAILDLMARSTTDRSVYRAVLASECERHENHSPSDFYHDDLSEFYKPFHFSEINAKLEKSGFRFLCESDFHSMSTRNLSKELQEFFKNNTDFVEREEYIDFVRGRQFRQTVFCRKSQNIDYPPKSENLFGLALASTVKTGRPEDVFKEGVAVSFVSSDGLGIEIDHQLTKAVLNTMGSRNNTPTRFEKLLEIAAGNCGILDYEAQAEICRRILLRLIEDTNIVELYADAPSQYLEISEKPQTNELVKWQLGIGNLVTSKFGTAIGIDDSISKQLLLLTDGTRDLKGIIDEVTAFVSETGSDNSSELPEDLESWITESLANATMWGLFV